MPNLEMLKEIKSLNMGDITLKVRTLPKRRRFGRGGQYLSSSKEILINPEKSYPTQVNTLVHEACHYFADAIVRYIIDTWETVGDNHKDENNAKFDMGEHLVQQLEMRIMTLLRLNPLLLKWIKKTNG